MTTQEAIDYLRVSRNTFYKWIRDGKLAPYNLNEALDRQPNPLYKQADLDAFVAARKADRLRREAEASAKKAE